MIDGCRFISVKMGASQQLVFLKANLLQRQFKEAAVKANANRRNKWADRIERCLSSNMSAEDWASSTT